MFMLHRDILAPTADGGYAVPAFNISDYSMFNGIVRAAERTGSPFIVGIHPTELAHIGTDVFAAIIQRANQSSVPIGLHLDHGATLEQVLVAIQSGFSSVMIDGSLLPYDENVALTQRVVEVAHAVGVFVEAELGTVGDNNPESHYESAEPIYTDPVQAVDFVTSTGVDSLAVAIGTAHGIYPADRQPELKLDLLAEINDGVTVPLVLHGGSNNPDEEVQAAVLLGVGKVNISADIKVAYYAKMREMLADPAIREPNQIQPPCEAAMEKVAEHKIDLFGSAGKADLYSGTVS